MMERDRDTLTEKRENKGHMPQGKHKKVKSRVKERGTREAGRQMPEANTHRKHIGRDSLK